LQVQIYCHKVNHTTGMAALHKNFSYTSVLYADQDWLLDLRSCLLT